VVASLEAFDAVRGARAGALRCKRRFGFAGRGQRVLPEQPSPADRRWLADALAAGGVVVEPELTGAEALSLHGVVDASGALLGGACRLDVDRFGAPTSVTRLRDTEVSALLAPQALEAVGHEVARRLDAAGYFGPFGIDVLLSGGEPRLIDVNARFTLGFSNGLGDRREAALERLTARGGRAPLT
jgi:hypothetical protein